MSERTAEDLVAQCRANARALAEDFLPVAQPALPVDDSLHTFTADQLHDLVYHSVTGYLRTLPSMPLYRAHEHAARLAEITLRDSGLYEHEAGQ